MNRHPLTDPTSLIAYRLANRETLSRRERRPPGTASPKSAIFVGIFGLGLLAAAILMLVVLAFVWR
jgi:hypothetical protein